CLALIALLGSARLASSAAEEDRAAPAASVGGAPAGDGALADERQPAQKWGFHAQTTIVYQFHPAFTSPYQGPHSLTPAAQGEHTFDVTLYGGVRLWYGAEFWVNPEIDQGFGLSDTHGVAGFPSAEAYKIGSTQPYGRVQRAFLRQTIDLGGETLKVDSD